MCSIFWAMDHFSRQSQGGEGTAALYLEDAERIGKG